MKLNIVHGLSVLPCLLLTLLSAPAFPADKDEKGAQRLGNQADLPKEHLGPVAKGNDVIGMNVKNKQDQSLGKVDDLAIDLTNGRIVEVIIQAGGFLGLGSRHIGVPSASFQFEAEAKTLRLDATKERLAAAPEFDLTKWAECCQPQRVTEVYRYYGREPYFAAAHIGTASPTGRGQVDLGHVEKASKVIGMSVKNRQDEKLGKVDNLVLDVPAGRVVQVILSSGGFLGVADTLSAVPPSAFRYNEERDTLQLDATKESLASAPHFKNSEWADVGDPKYVASVYRAYRVEPYFDADADNTGRNVRDRDDRSLTPLDQGNTRPDLDTTARIRKDIVNRDGLSVSAQNVKVITANGRVTLRGPVNSEEEKRMLGEIAARVARPENVDNQLEVKARANRD